MSAILQSAGKHYMRKAFKGANGSISEFAKDAMPGNGEGLSGNMGIVAGTAAAALLPVAARAAAKRFDVDGPGDLLDKSPGDLFESPGEGVRELTNSVRGKAVSGLEDKISEKVGEIGGPAGGILKKLLPFGGGDDDEDDEGSAPGVGKGRRMPIQQSVDIGLPVETVYNQWTQFEMWPNFMHRVTQVSQDDPCTVSFTTKIWGKTKEFKAEIKTQRPDERIHWEVTEGISHTGVVTFHELGPSLTRVLLQMNVEPNGMLEKLARGARYIKRASRADLHRFKAFIETSEEETGAWRGVIEDGKVKKRSSGSGSKSGRSSSGSSGSSRSSGRSRSASNSSGRSGRRQTAH